MTGDGGGQCVEVGDGGGCIEGGVGGCFEGGGGGDRGGDGGGLVDGGEGGDVGGDGASVVGAMAMVVGDSDMVTWQCCSKQTCIRKLEVHASVHRPH